MERREILERLITNGCSASHLRPEGTTEEEITRGERTDLAADIQFTSCGISGELSARSAGPVATVIEAAWDELGEKPSGE